MSDLSEKRRRRGTAPDFAVATVKRYAGELRRYFNRRLGRIQDVDDLAQEVYFRLLRIDPDLQVEKPLQFMYGVARRVLADHRAQVATDEEHLASADDRLASWANPTTALEDRPEENLEVEGQLEMVLSRIPPMHAAILILHMRDGMSYQEVAGKLGISVHTVHKYLTEARARIRMTLWDT